MVLYCRGDTLHTYAAGAYTTEGARKWLEHSKVGQDSLQNVAVQMEGFNISGCRNSIKIQGDVYHSLIIQYLILT
jgi:hypothetical protein